MKVHGVETSHSGPSMRSERSRSHYLKSQEKVQWRTRTRLPSDLSVRGNCMAQNYAISVPTASKR